MYILLHLLHPLSLALFYRVYYAITFLVVLLNATFKCLSFRLSFRLFLFFHMFGVILLYTLCDTVYARGMIQKG